MLNAMLKMFGLEDIGKRYISSSLGGHSQLRETGSLNYQTTLNQKRRIKPETTTILRTSHPDGYDGGLRRPEDMPGVRAANHKAGLAEGGETQFWGRQ